ncbi:MAG: CHAD domain-containing protein [Rhodocyclaceae bacterium]|nr:CHAD domain-containing protein [Rhodocyclaceae bacterium]
MAHYNRRTTNIYDDDMAEKILLKLTVNERDIPRLLRHRFFREAPAPKRETLVSIYYDTRTLRLQSHGVSLRLRKQASGWLQTVKYCEHADNLDTPLATWNANYFNRFDFSSIDDSALRDWLFRDKIRKQIAPIFESNLRRTVWQVKPIADVTMQVTLDRGSLVSSGRRAPFADLELRMIEGDVDNLYTLALQFAERVSITPMLQSKAERGCRLFLNTVSAPARADDFSVSAETMPLIAFRQIAMNCLQHMQRNQAGAATTNDPEYIHQMRVATRRLRASVQLFKPLLPPPFADDIVAPLRELMHALGRVRDLDIVITEIISPVIADMPNDPALLALSAVITERQYQTRLEAMHALAQPAYGHLQLRATALLNSPAFIALPDHQSQATLSEFAQTQLQAHCARTINHAARAHADEPNSLHRLRISIKRLRYAMEFFRAMMPAKACNKILQNLAATQEKLGQLNDLAGAGAVLMHCAASDSNLRQAINLIAAWHARRHADLLAEVAVDIKRIKHLKLPQCN